MSSVPEGIDRLEPVFDDGSLVADAGLLAAATLAERLGLEGLVDETLRMSRRPGGANPGRKVLTLVMSILAGGSHIDHADRLRAGRTRRVLGFVVAAPSTLGTFLRAFTWGHVRQLDKALGEALRRAWQQGAGPGREPVTIDVDSTIREVSGKAKEGAAYGYTGQWGITRCWRSGPAQARSWPPACGAAGPGGATSISSPKPSAGRGKPAQKVR